MFTVSCEDMLYTAVSLLIPYSCLFCQLDSAFTAKAACQADVTFSWRLAPLQVVQTLAVHP